MQLIERAHHARPSNNAIEETLKSNGRSKMYQERGRILSKEVVLASVGIIANPAAGKDIRRIVAHASTFDNNEKVNIVRRVLLGLQAAGVEDVLLMPDAYGIGTRALDRLNLSMRTVVLEMTPEFTQHDSTRAAALLRDQAVGCIITLGGDGTNRAVAKGCGAVPLVPISTGTNNVFPQMIEGTVAGLAAGVVARGMSDPAMVTRPSLLLEILCGDTVVDLALIDVVVCAERFVGTRAVWDEHTIRQIISTRADPSAIGFSAVGGSLDIPDLDSCEGLAIDLGEEGRPVVAAIAPGYVRMLHVRSHRRLGIGDVVRIEAAPAVLALDGEREFIVGPDDVVAVRLSDTGPRVVDVRAALRQAAAQGFFIGRGGDRI